MRARLHVHGTRSRVLLGTVSAVALLFGVAWTSGVSAAASTTTTPHGAPPATPRPHRASWTATASARCRSRCGRCNCTDIRGIPGKGNANTWGGRFYDNGHYIGHDEPDTTFLSNAPGSGNNVNWTLTLGRDPTAAPTVRPPGP